MRRTANARSTLLRQWHMLRLLPRYPTKTTAREIRDRLAAQQFETTTRTVQRDLIELSRAFPIAFDERSKPYGWSWAKDAPSLALPSLTVAEAMTLQMVEQHLKGLLPASTVSVLERYFRAAAERIEAATGRRRHVWLDRVRVLPPAQQLGLHRKEPTARGGARHRPERAPRASAALRTVGQWKERLRTPFRRAAGGAARRLAQKLAGLRALTPGDIVAALGQHPGTASSEPEMIFASLAEAERLKADAPAATIGFLGA
ncbi:MAG: hypothetical protein N2653_05260 [Burkholderiales bacterium]|nr:hypothetical protein [Burkholderiales bacterium]